MARSTIVAQFRDYGAAHRAFYELLQTGTAPNQIGIIAGDRSNHPRTHHDFRFLEDDAENHLSALRQGRTLLAVQVDDGDRARVATIIEHHAPIDIEESQRSAAGFSRG
jgi:hypothetical protein